MITLPNGNIASSSYGNTIKIWNPNNGLLLNTLSVNSSISSTLVALPNGNLVFSSGPPDNTIKILNSNNGSLLFTIKTGIVEMMSIALILRNGNLAYTSSEHSIMIFH